MYVHVWVGVHLKTMLDNWWLIWLRAAIKDEDDFILLGMDFGKERQRNESVWLIRERGDPWTNEV